MKKIWNSITYKFALFAELMNKSLYEMFLGVLDKIKENTVLILNVMFVICVFCCIRFEESNAKAFVLFMCIMFLKSLFARMIRRSGISDEIPIRKHRFTELGKYGVQMDIRYQDDAMNYLYEMENYLELKGYAKYNKDE